MTLMMNDITVTPCVNDKVIQQLLLKLEEVRKPSRIHCKSIYKLVIKKGFRDNH